MNMDALQAYHQADISRASFADPHQLIVMLMDGALDRIAKAKGSLLQNQHSEKGKHISHTITIISGLSECLDMDTGGDLSSNLADLYDYMNRQLLQANLKNDAKFLDEVSSLLNEIKGAWIAIPLPVREEYDKQSNQQVAEVMAD